MSGNTKKIVLVDTNVLIEAHRTGCLKPLCIHHQMVSVAKCIEETQTGHHTRGAEETIPSEFLKQSLSQIADVSLLQLATLELRLPNGPYLDDGEKHLLAHALTRGDSFLLCGPDKAMIRAVHNLGLIERLVSLDQLATEAHVAGRQLRRLGVNFRNPWLEEERTKVRLGSLV